MIDCNQQEPLALNICADESAILTLLEMKNLEDHNKAYGIQLNKDVYFGSQVNSLSHIKIKNKINKDSHSENLKEVLSNMKKENKICIH